MAQAVIIIRLNVKSEWRGNERGEETRGERGKLKESLLFFSLLFVPLVTKCNKETKTQATEECTGSVTGTQRERAVQAVSQAGCVRETVQQQHFLFSLPLSLSVTRAMHCVNALVNVSVSTSRPPGK